MWKLCLSLLAVLAVMMLATSVLMRSEEVFRSSFTYSNQNKGEASFVTPVFELKGRPSNVEIDIRTDLENDWASFGMALINEQTGAGYDFGSEVSYYHGRDSDGNWSEGGRGDSTVVPSVPPGRYYLRVEPEMNAEDGARHSVRYDLTVRRDVPLNWLFFIAGFLLLIPPIVVSMRSFSFESQRWSESSYAHEAG